MARPPELLMVQNTPIGNGVTCMEVFTDQGVIVCLRHGLESGETNAVLCVPGALGGLSGPGRGIFHDICTQLGGVRIHYRKPNDITHCIFDVLLVQHLLADRGVNKAVLVGHSFGGAIAIAAGVHLGDATAGVITLASQVPGAEGVAELAGTPLLLIHGDQDEILNHQCSQYLYGAASDPKELVIVPGEGHMFTGVSDALVDRVLAFSCSAFGLDIGAPRNSFAAE